MDKKGMIWDEIGKALLVLVIIVVVLLIIWLLKDKLGTLTTKMKFLFGG